MVDRVGNGPGYNYPSLNERKVNNGATGAGEKFQLDYGKEGAIYEPSSEALKRQQEDKKAIARTVDNLKTKEDGVHLTLSSSVLKQDETVDDAQALHGGGIFDALTEIVDKIMGAIKDFFSSLWNDEPTVNDLTNEVTEKPKTQFEKAKAEAEAFLASTEGKKVARNSDLLTYYDKHGSVVNVSPSDRQRILYGDKNQIEV